MEKIENIVQDKSVKTGVQLKEVVSVVIVNYKSWDHLYNCLLSIKKIHIDNLELDVVVIDNDKVSDSRKKIVKEFTEFSFFENTGNNGFANACNLGARKAKGEYLLFLNPDTIISKATLLELVTVVKKQHSYGIVSCLQINESGAEEKQIRFFPALKTLFGLFRALYRFRNKKELDKKYDLKKTIVFPDWVSGSVVMMRRQWFDLIEGWNEDYWMYYEDVDLCKRVTDKGGKIALLRNVRIVHNHGGASRLNMETSILTRSQVLISKHVYIDNSFSGSMKNLIQFLLFLYNFMINFFGALTGVLLFFIPKIYLRFFVYKNMLSYYNSCLKYKTWLSDKSMNHCLNSSNYEKKSDKLIIGYDAKRVYHNRTGLGNYSRDLVSVLARFYKKNKLLLYNPKEKKIDRLVHANNIIEVLPKSVFWKKYSSVWRQGPIVKQLVEDGVQIFHGLSGEIPRGLESTGIKSVVTIHDLIFIRYPKLYKYMDRKIHFRKFLFAAQNADKIIAISKQTKKDIVQFFKIDSNKIEVVYQGCHKLFKEEQPEVFKESVRDKFGLPKSFILNVGTIEERKNLLLCVKAIKDIDEVLVVVGGKTKYYDVVLRYLIDNNIQDKVLFLENVGLKELVALYQMANLFVYPSLFEGFGIPIIEALYCKTPVISSKGGCFSEAGGPGSLYVDPTDENELQEKIEEVLSSSNLREQMIRDGYEFVQRFNDKDIAENMMKIYTAMK